LQVEPKVPERLERLHELAGNFWFSWHRPTRQLFYMLDHELWWGVAHNPGVFLRCVDQGVLDRAAEDEIFLAAYRKVLAEFDSYLEPSTNGNGGTGLESDDLVAYFCAEYGFHESFPIYSGGLGILAGDHCKTASDMRLPFVAVGLLYRQGYFRQRIDRSGNQVAEYPYHRPEDTPVQAVTDDSNNQLAVHISMPGRDVAIKVWRAIVGRVSVLLLDTDVAENTAEDREITRALYSGDTQRRIEQEIILGVGGVRALRAAGMQPRVWHINEGHAAFLILERARELVAGGLPFTTALEVAGANTVFTTHTPVPAGHDVFPPELVSEYFGSFAGELGLTEDEFLALGRGESGFNMTKLAIAGARSINGVSRIHGQVSAEICQSAWPEVPPLENPVGYVTNGVHVPTFVEQDWSDLLEQNLGPSWRYRLTDRDLIDEIDGIPDGRFWYVNQRVKANMLTALRTRLERQHRNNRVSDAHIARLLRHLDPERPEVLTIGFARRFATYKRSTLLFHDIEWLRQIVNNEDRPVVFIYAGKAHPADELGQDMIRQIHHIANTSEFVGKIILAEGYDMGLGRLLTAGVDVWLNTPIAPLEASGTSGMKAALNGTCNLSVLDGWWAECYDGTNGWGIPPSEHEDNGARDSEDARTLFETLQDDVIPLYYDRSERLGYSEGWVRRCKRSMATVMPAFNSHRVLEDYTRLFYVPAAGHGRRIADENFGAASQLADWKTRVHAAWPEVRLELTGETEGKMGKDDRLALDVDVRLGGLSPEDVQVECVLNRVVASSLDEPEIRYASDGRMTEGVRHLDDEHMLVQALDVGEQTEGGTWRYHLDLQSPWCGVLNYGIRVVPRHELLLHAHETGLMRWL
jgi:starch phosphorylase